jgi:hypothetical protein
MNDGRDGVRVCFGCRCAPSRAGWGSTRRGAGRFARARRCALYRETYLHDRHVHDGLHPLDAAHGRLGHGAREIDRSVASRAKRPNAECPGNARGSSGERATFGPTRRGEVSPTRRGRGGRRNSAQMTGVGAYATGLSWRVRRERCCSAIWPSACLPIRNSKPALSRTIDTPIDANSQKTNSETSRCARSAPSLSPRGTAEGTQRASSPPRVVSRDASPRREYPAPRVRKSRDSPIVARVVRAIGRG